MGLYKVGNKYSRKDIFTILGLQDRKGGDWFTGYVSHDDDWYIFTHIESAGRTGHNYKNHFNGDNLIWFGKTNSKLKHDSIQRLISGKGKVYIFCREGDRDPFEFKGEAKPVRVEDVSPVCVEWSFVDDESRLPFYFAEEVPESSLVFEGMKKTVTVNKYERDSKARATCIRHWGLRCVVCGFNFEEKYGSLGEGFIHVHHLRPLGEIQEGHELDAKKDLRPVCPNCHAMLHRREPVFSIDELKVMIRTGS